MSYRSVNPAGAKALLDGREGWTYVDVRTEEEFALGHAPGAYNVPVAFRGPRGMEPNERFVEVMERTFPRERPLVVACAMGGRSARACELLAQAGFSRLVNMDGGFSGVRDASGAVREPGWQACGYAVSTDCPPERSWPTLSRS
jgi:rhodanese-related sulfurtransferase